MVLVFRGHTLNYIYGSFSSAVINLTCNIIIRYVFITYIIWGEIIAILGSGLIETK